MSSVISIPGNIIVINRGDTYTFDLDILDENENIYRLQGNDALYFGLIDPRQSFEDALIKKKFTIEDYEDGVEGESTIISFEITPEDTIDLYPGKYYYSIKLKQDHYEEDDLGNIVKVTGVKTIINKTKFIIND